MLNVHHCSVFLSLSKSLSNYGGAANGRILIFFLSKMLKIHFHLNVVVVKSTHILSSLLKNDVDSMLRAYLHIYFQSINAAFKTWCTGLFYSFRMSNSTAGNQRYSKSSGSPHHELEVAAHSLNRLILPSSVSSANPSLVKGPPLLTADWKC